MSPSRRRVEFHVESELLDRIQARAAQLGLTISSYIRMASSRYLEQDRAELLTAVPRLAFDQDQKAQAAPQDDPGD